MGKDDHRRIRCLVYLSSKREPTKMYAHPTNLSRDDRKKAVSFKRYDPSNPYDETRYSIIIRGTVHEIRIPDVDICDLRIGRGVKRGKGFRVLNNPSRKL